MLAMFRRMVTAAMLALIGGCLVLTVALFVMSSLGLSFSAESGDDHCSTVPVHDFEADPYYTNELQIETLPNGYYYEQLDEGLQRQYEYALYELLRTASEETILSDGEVGTSITFRGYRHTDETIERLFYAVLYDHPELFFLRTGYTYAHQGTVATIGWRFSMDLEERRYAQRELKATLQALDAACTAQTPYETERYYHDALLARCTYDDEAAESDAQSDMFAKSSSPYAALCGGKAICGGYARALHWLLSRAKLPSTVVTNTDHAWTMVWIDGDPYHVDPTWNDADDRVISHGYFNVTDEDLLTGREFAEQVVAFPEATAVSANFYRAEGHYIEEVPSKELTESLRRQAEEGTQIEWRFAPDVYEQAVAFIESGEVFAEFGFLDEVGDVARWSKIAYQTDDRIHTAVLSTSNT